MKMEHGEKYNKIKICAISDLHGILPNNIKPCDLLLICGDILPLEIQSDVLRTEIWIVNDFSNWIQNLPCTHCIGVLGNHDIGLKRKLEILNRLYKSTKNKVEFLENTETNVVFEDKIIKIWGSPWCKIFGKWEYMASDEKLQEYYSTMPKACDIVITHDTPAAGDLGIITEGKYIGEKAGNKILAKIIKEKQPQIALSGHIHSSNHKLEKKKGFGNTLFATVSLVNEKYQPIYEPLYFEI